MDTAKAYHLGAQIKVALGEIEYGLDLFARSEAIFAEHFQDRKEFGELLYEMVGVFYDLHLRDEAAEYARRSLEILRNFDGSELAHLERMIRLLSLSEYVEDSELDQAELEQLRTQFRTARRGRTKALAGHDLVEHLIRSSRPADHLAEIHDVLEEAFRLAESANELDNQIGALTTLIDMYWLHLPLPAWAPSATEAVLHRAQAHGGLDAVAIAYAVQAAIAADRGNLETALGDALQAVAISDAYVADTASSALRALTNLRGSTHRELALTIAVAMDDPSLAAELLESARLQVLPEDLSEQGRKPPRFASLNPTFRTAASQLTAVRPIAVRGVSRLASLHLSKGTHPPIQLEQCIEAVGGPDSWWWAAWAVSGRLYWAVLGDGSSHCGIVELAGDANLAAALETAFQQSLLNGNAKTADVLSGPWCRSNQAESALSSILGDRLIPRPLRDKLMLPGSDKKPLSLILSGNLFGILPIALLSVGPAAGFADRTRLIERAVLRTAPPAVLVEKIRQHPFYIAESRSVSISCVNPRGDLSEANGVPDYSGIVLSGNGGDGHEASRKNLVEALRAGRMAWPALFYYSGHGSHEGIGGDIADGLALSDGTLTAEAVFTLAADGGPSIPFPDRSLLSACQLSGAAGAGAGEWLGLTAAILWAGSRQVVATNWTIWDIPFTARFDSRLAELMCEAGDVAESLRALQIVYLNEWRRSLHDLSDHVRDTLPAKCEDVPFPMVWAAYTCAGVYW
jgi:hypothetical protein